MKIIGKYSVWLMAVVATLTLTHNLSAQGIEESREAYGTTAYSEAPDLSQAAGVAAVKPIVVIKGASYATGASPFAIAVRGTLT